MRAAVFSVSPSFCRFASRSSRIDLTFVANSFRLVSSADARTSTAEVCPPTSFRSDSREVISFLRSASRFVTRSASSVALRSLSETVSISRLSGAPNRRVVFSRSPPIIAPLASMSSPPRVTSRTPPMYLRARSRVSTTIVSPRT